MFRWTLRRFAIPPAPRGGGGAPTGMKRGPHTQQPSRAQGSQGRGKVQQPTAQSVSRGTTATAAAAKQQQPSASSVPSTEEEETVSATQSPTVKPTAATPTAPSPPQGQAKRAVPAAPYRPPPSGAIGFNRISVVGIAHDVQTGFLQDIPVTQFTVTTNRYQLAEDQGASATPEAGACGMRFSKPTEEEGGVESANSRSGKGHIGAKGILAKGSSSGGSSSSGGGTGSSGGSEGSSPSILGSNVIGNVPYERDNFTVRCLGSSAEEANKLISEGFVVRVSGRFRMNPQLEPAQSREKFFPFIQVGKASSPAGDETDTGSAFGTVEVLSGSRRRVRMEALQRGVEQALSETKTKPTSSVVRPSA